MDTGVHAKGDKGEKGDKGDKGDTGEQGVKGEDGTSVLTGVGAPNSSLGKEGDSYIDTSTWNYYQKTSSDWESKGNIKGGQGETGETGETGKSAYELYCQEHPEYAGSLSEWLDALTNGDLADDIVITLDTNGGDLLNSITTRPNSYIEIQEPIRPGYVFENWYLNGSPIDVNTYVFTTSCTLVAHYRSADIKVQLDANGGEVAYNTTVIKYGSAYTLPTPTKKHQTFDGWYCNNRKISNSGTWSVIKQDCILVAKWNTKEVTVTLTVDSEYGSCSSTSASVVAGNQFSLPVPTSKTDATFQGWFYGETQLTDAKGKSLMPFDYSTSVILNAKFYTEISNIYQVLSMSNAESTTGNYRITKDLDFEGLDMSPIENFSGVFDGGGHKLSNIHLSSGKGQYGGFFGKISRKTIIKNLVYSKMELSGDWGVSGGLVGCVEGEEIGREVSTNGYSRETFDVCLDNITFEESFNGPLSNQFGLFVGAYVNNFTADYKKSRSSTYSVHNFEPTSKQICLLSGRNLTSVDTLQGNYASKRSFFVGQNKVTVENTAYTNESMVVANVELINDINSINEKIPSQIRLEGLRLLSNRADSVNYQSANGLLSQNISDASGRMDKDCVNKIKIAMKASYLQNNLDHLDHFITSSAVASQAKIDVCNSANYGSTMYAWGGVNCLTNCISTSPSDYWGAKNSIQCIDAGIQGQKFDYNAFTSDGSGIATNCVSLIPDGNGVYRYYNSASKMAEVKKASLINKDFFVSLLKFDEGIWNFDNLNVTQKKYPTIR